MLRVVRLPEATVDHAPVSLDTGYALDECVRREGWIAFPANVDVWGVPLPLGEPPFLIARDTRLACSGLDQAAVWLRRHDGRLIEEYDGKARKVRRQVELPEDFGAEGSDLIGETRSGLLLGLGEDKGLFSWQPPGEPSLLLEGVTAATLDPTGTTVLCWRHARDELVLFDLHRATHTAIPKPSGCRWPLFEAAFSPDGAWLAVDLDYSIEYSDEELSAQLQDVMRGRGTDESQPHRLGIIHCVDGTMTITEEEYDNFANLVWSLDSEWIIFSTPFAPRALSITRPSEAKLARVEFGRAAPSLLCDISDSVP
jgi:hypothetical protein